MSLFRKDVLLEIGLFDETNITEDMEIGLRLQHSRYRIAACPEAIIETVVPNNFWQLFRQRTRWYRGKFVNTRKYSDMVFNPKFGEFGMFSFPFSLVTDFLAILLISVTIVANAGTVLQYFGFVVSNVALGNSLLSSVSGFSIHSSMYFYFFTVVLYSFLVYVSHGFVNDRLSLWKLPELVFYMFVYGFFISLVYFTSFFKEINASDYVW
jgi:cellulose synthase/poly-beta-1,6-N-acetylglucosamine synthase-like glycosyltransferase